MFDAGETVYISHSVTIHMMLNFLVIRVKMVEGNV